MSDAEDEIDIEWIDESDEEQPEEIHSNQEHFTKSSAGAPADSDETGADKIPNNATAEVNSVSPEQSNRKTLAHPSIPYVPIHTAQDELLQHSNLFNLISAWVPELSETEQVANLDRLNFDDAPKVSTNHLHASDTINSYPAVKGVRRNYCLARSRGPHQTRGEPVLHPPVVCQLCT